MINQEKLIEAFRRQGVEFFTGVPDSFLNGFCTCLTSAAPPERHVITANEGNAVAMAAGYYLATGRVPLVYMQNSGMGNAVNPILSLTDKQVYSIPMVFLIGWRGQSGTGDHDHHAAQGRLTLTLLDDMEIPYRILSDNDADASADAAWSVQTARESSLPAALVVPKGVCTGEKKPFENETYPLSREDAIRIVIEHSPPDAACVATTGRATRELYAVRTENGAYAARDFLNVGAMGHAVSVAQGLALADKSRPVICFDGDAAAIMHMGSLTMASKLDVPNLLHIVLNNGAHESVGGQPSAGHLIDFTGIAAGCGYETAGKAVETQRELCGAIERLSNRTRAGFIDVKIRKGIRKGLPSIDISTLELKKKIMFEYSK